MTVNNPTNPRRFAAATLLVAAGAVAIAALSATAPASASPDNSSPVVTTTSNTPIAKTIKTGHGLGTVNPPIRLHCVTDKDGSTRCWIE